MDVGGACRRLSGPREQICRAAQVQSSSCGLRLAVGDVKQSVMVTDGWGWGGGGGGGGGWGGGGGGGDFFLVGVFIFFFWFLSGRVLFFLFVGDFFVVFCFLPFSRPISSDPRVRSSSGVH